MNTRMKTAIVCAGLLTAAGSVAVAQEETLQLDLNQLAYQVFDIQGMPSSFDGETHTGAVTLWADGPSALLKVLIREAPGLPFVNQTSYSGDLTGLAITLELDNGAVVGGDVSIEIDDGPGSGGDLYTAFVLDGAGSVKATAIGGYTIDALTFEGAFSDDNFGGVDILPWYVAQASQVALEGSLYQFNFDPSPTGEGHADIDMFTTVPTPGTMALLGGGLLLAWRRKR